MTLLRNVSKKFWKKSFLTIVNFKYSEKATKFCRIFTLLLSYVVPVKSKVKILQNFWPSQNIWTLLFNPIFHCARKNNYTTNTLLLHRMKPKRLGPSIKFCLLGLLKPWQNKNDLNDIIAALVLVFFAAGSWEKGTENGAAVTSLRLFLFY